MGANDGKTKTDSCLVWTIVCFLVLASESVLLAVVAIANFAISVFFVSKYVPMEDE